MNPTVVGIILIVSIVGYSIFSVMHKQKTGMKNARSGEDKARVRALLEKTLPEEIPVTPICGRILLLKSDGFLCADFRQYL